MAGKPAKTLTANDRKRLCGITSTRFEILNSELRRRKNYIRNEIEKQVQAEHEKDIAVTRDKLKNWQKDHEKMEEKVRELQKAVEAKKVAIIEEAKTKGLKVQKPSYGVEIEEISVRNLSETVTNRMDSILKDYNAAEINLKTMELQTLEQISIAGLETDEGRDFLGEIPELDTLLPPPDDIPALVRGK